MKTIYIIAEAGVNHNGSLEQAKKMVDAAAEAGADAVKFQTFDPESMVTETANTAEYQSNGGFTDQKSMLEGLLLSRDEFYELKDYCTERGIEFLSTVFDLPSFRMLHEMGQTTWKISSGDITNVPLLEAIGAVAEWVILSTGMATLGEVEHALGCLEEAGTGRDRVTVLHCNTEYPTPYEDVNLRAMKTMAQAFGVEVGYSDHTLGIEIPVAAVAMGASVIEKHFTLDKNLPGPDHKASLEPEELKQMVTSIRNLETALGSRQKKVTTSEEKNKKVVRKGIYAAEQIKMGDVFTKENLIVKRPEHEVNAAEWDRVMKKSARRDYEKDEPIQW